MPTFYDPITQLDLEISEATIFYLVRRHVDLEQPIKNTFRIQGLSASPDRLASDPITNAKQYWPISVHDSVQKMIDIQLDEKIKSLLFSDDQLIKRPLSLQEVNDCFEFNPNEVPDQAFSEEVGRNLHRFWETNMVQPSSTGRLYVGYATSEQISTLVTLSQGMFVGEEIENFLGYVIQRVITFCEKTMALDLFVNGYFTKDNLLTFAFDHEDISELLTVDCVQALKDQTITGDDLQAMHARDKRLLLINPRCLHALHDKKTSVEVLRNLSQLELSDAIAHNEFPPITGYTPSL